MPNFLSSLGSALRGGLEVFTDEHAREEARRGGIPRILQQIIQRERPMEFPVGQGLSEGQRVIAQRRVQQAIETGRRIPTNTIAEPRILDHHNAEWNAFKKLSQNQPLSPQEQNLAKKYTSALAGWAIVFMAPPGKAAPNPAVSKLLQSLKEARPLRRAV